MNEVPNRGNLGEKTMATRPGDMRDKTSLIVNTAEDFVIETESPKNFFGDPDFVEFVCSGTRSPETLMALGNLYRTLKVEGISITNNNVVLRFIGGTIEMTQDQDGDKYIRVWRPILRESCELRINQSNASPIILQRISEILIAMELDDKLRPVRVR